jgi:hypothetical protein
MARVNESERREDGRRKAAMYDSPAMDRYRAERDHKPDARDAMRRAHAEQTAKRHAEENDERTRLYEKHKIALDRHFETSRSEPVALKKQQKGEADEMKMRHRLAAERERAQQRAERDRQPA